MTRIKLIEDKKLKAGFIDSITQTSDALEISGWAINPKQMKTVNKVLIIDSNYQYVGFIDINIDRPDVAMEMNNPGLVHCGWSTTLEHNGKTYLFFAYDDKKKIGYILTDRSQEGNEVLQGIKKQSVNAIVHNRGTIVFVSHNATRTGAPVLLLNLIRWFLKSTAFEVKIILFNDGELRREFQSIAPTLLLWAERGKELTESQMKDSIREFCGESVTLFYLNTIVTANSIHLFSEFNSPIITHIHELENIIQDSGGKSAIRQLRDHSSRIICASPAVSENLKTRHGIPETKLRTIYSFIKPYFMDVYKANKKDARRRLGIDEDTFIVFGCGTIEWRKGPDLFIKTAAKVREHGLNDFHFYWIGAAIPEQHYQVDDEIRRLDLTDKVTFLGTVHQDPREYFAAGDLFLLSSREDPFPLVCLEAAEAFCPILCFKGAGGMPDFVEDDAGFVIPLNNTDEMAKKIILLANDRELTKKMGICARKKVVSRFLIDNAACEILDIIRKESNIPPAVSIIVPNYNKEVFLKERLNSIFNQTFKDYELIILDDASSDHSKEIIETYKARCKSVTVEYNPVNRGVFHQWNRGMELARSDFIWIAEADDYCCPEFLENLLPVFSDPDVNLAYSDSYIVDTHGKTLYCYSDTEYLADISHSKWDNSYTISGEEEVNDALCIKNTIPNASAVIFRRFDISKWLMDVRDMKLAGDWLFYLYALRTGKICYINKPLNFHRRHENTATTLAEGNQPIFEEIIKVQKTACELFPISPGSLQKMIRQGKSAWDSLGFNRDFPIQIYEKFRRSDAKTTHAVVADRWIVATTYIADISGAPNTILLIANELIQKYQCKCLFLIAIDGPLREDFEKLGPVKIIDLSQLNNREYITELRDSIRSVSPSCAICNGMDSSEFINQLHAMKIPIITLIHEFADYYPKFMVERLCKQSDHMIYSARTVYDATVEKIGWKPEPASFIPQGLQNPEILKRANKRAVLTIRRKHRIEDESFIVLSCGLMHTRKGCDLFVSLAKIFFTLMPDAKCTFLWAGPYDGSLENPSSWRFWVENDIKKCGLSGKVMFVGEQKDIVPYFLAADVFVLTSRLDPFPNVVLESMAAEIPVLCFDKGTGAVDAVGDEGGYIVPYLDITAMAKKLVHLYQNDDERKRMGQRNKSVIEQDYSFEQYVMKIHERILKNYLD